MQNRYWTMILLLIGVSACEPDLGLNIEPEPSRLVVNCLFHPGERWRIEVSRTVSAFSQSTPAYVNNARVTVYDSTAQFTIVLNNNGEGRYVSFGSPIPGHVYLLRVETSGLGVVTARSEVPLTPPTVVSRSVASVTSDFLPFFIGEIEITDQDLIDEYFLVDLYIGDSEDPNNGRENLFFTPLTSNDPFIESSDDFAIGGTRNKFEVLLLRDELIPSDGYLLKFEIADYLLENLPPTLFALQRVSNVTQDYFLYMESVQDYKASEGNPILELPKIYSNIDGGYGIFAGGNSLLFQVKYR